MNQRRNSRNRNTRRKSKRKSKTKRKPRKWSIGKARMISKKKYKSLLKKKTVTPKEKKELDRALFVNYCKCIKKLKYNTKDPKGIEYPICNNSIYKNRNYKVPSGIKIKCRDYY